MKSFKLALLAAASLAALADQAVAQTAPTPTPPPLSTTVPAIPAVPQEAPADEETRVEDVTVVARATDVRTSIDSISYSLADDLQATTGSLADALRNVPSVDVDTQGNVALRGDGNVTILIDGRPSGMLSGEGRGQAIQQMQADQYVRIEVMTNPSAAYSPEGSGGVINLITRPSALRPGRTTTGSVRSNIGNEGRLNLGLSGAQVNGPLTISGDLGVRHDNRSQEIDRERAVLDPASGRFLPSTLSQDTEAETEGLSVRLSVDYKLTEQTQATLEARGNDFQNQGVGTAVFVGRNAAGGVSSSDLREFNIDQLSRTQGLTARLLHEFDDAGHDWTNELRFDRGENNRDLASVASPIVPVGPDNFERVGNDVAFTVLALTSAYVRPIGDDAKLRLGYELENRHPEQGNLVSRGPSAGALTVVPALTNRFEAEQTVHALYATYERPFGDKLSAQFGLRLEQADIEINQITTGVQASQSYFRAYPTAHLIYQLSEAQSVRASYSRRIQRPQVFLLNPFVSYVDPLNLRSGNVNLEPQETDAFEVMWQMRAEQSFYQATAYYRDTRKAFTEVASDIGGGVLLTRPENLGARRDTGIEVVASGRLLPTLRYSASLNVFRQEIEASGIPGAAYRSGTRASGRVNMNWQPTPADFVQIAGMWQGETLLAQGTRESGGMINLGYRRRLTENLTMQLTIRDVFDAFGDVTIYDTPTFRDRTERNFDGRVGYIGLTWTLGGAPQRLQNPQFDFTDPQPEG